MDPITTYFLAKEAGWKRIAKKEVVKTAFTVKDLLGGAKKAVPYIALGLGAGGIGYNVLKDRNIEGMEKNRELVGAMNDTVVRQRVGDIYRMAGFPEPPMPLAVSKEISPEYKRVIAEMSSKGAMEKDATNPLVRAFNYMKHNDPPGWLRAGIVAFALGNLTEKGMALWRGKKGAPGVSNIPSESPSGIN